MVARETTSWMAVCMDGAHFNGLEAHTRLIERGTISGPDGADSFTNIERLYFAANNKLAIDISAMRAQPQDTGRRLWRGLVSNAQYVVLA